MHCIKDLLNVLILTAALCLTVAASMPMSLTREELYQADFDCKYQYPPRLGLCLAWLGRSLWHAAVGMNCRGRTHGTLTHARMHVCCVFWLCPQMAPAASTDASAVPCLVAVTSR